MMTQADVLSESMKNDEQLAPSSAAYVNEAANPQNTATTHSGTAPDLVTNTADYNYENGNVRLGGLANNPENAKNENTPIQPMKYFAQDSAMNSSKGLRNIIIGGMVFSGVITIALIIQIAIGTTQVPYRIGIVTQEKVCSDIGADMVHKGGKSIDAFIASSLCLGVVNPFSAGPGAGGFLLIRDHKHDKNIALNCFFKSSGNLDTEDFQTNPETGKRSIGIPGEYKCIREVYKYARFNWHKLTKPASDLANKGFKVSRNLANHLKQLELKDIQKDPLMAEMYLRNGQLVRENDIIVNKRLGNTLKRLRDNDNDLYDGNMADSIVDQLETNSKTQFNTRDLRNYQASSEKVEVTNYNDFILLTAPYPSNGPVLRYILEMMHSLELKVGDFKSTTFFNNLLKAASMGYKLSAYTADPTDSTLLTIYEQALKYSKTYFKNFVSGNTSKILKDPLSDFQLDNYELNDDLVTNFISVNDHNDLMISYTGTLGSAWGSGVMSKEGFMFNNALSLFTYGSSNSNENNGIAQNKQPRALFTPILTYNGKNPCVRRFAVSYGHRKMSDKDDFGLTELTEVILKLFTDYSLYETAISDKRIQYHYESSSCFEDGFDTTIKSEVLGKKLYTERNNCTYHGIDLIMKKDHIIYAQTDVNRSLDQAVLFNK